ncbi:FtsK/SpoIIIE domain-containing protein, partial [Klenkia sp. PcliD-1-E]|uniref:FtsK/SpoIIIE domain-containing protein n=1 Tax=Klenkia sp. PcliD-1-E TaxID=2954492 RepID=UPI0020968FE5
RTAEHVVDLARADTEVAAAVAAETGLREQLAPDPACLVAAARRRGAPLWERPATDPGLLVVRVGTGPGSTGVSRRHGEGAPAPVRAARLPVLLDLREGGLEVRGPRPAVLGALRQLVCQVAVLHPPDAVSLTLLTGHAEAADWIWARWLPHLEPTPGPDGVRLVVVDGQLGDEDAERLRQARQDGAVVVGRVPGGATALLEVAGETGARARLRRAGRPDADLVLDQLAAGLAEQVAADLAPLTVPAGPGGLPDAVRWRDLVGPVPTPWSRSRTTLSAVLGTAAAGTVTLDLCALGPHALVAGTTGAGKSELLRTLVLGLATAHPPDLCSFLLVDYKGGAAFGEAADLPHTVGVLTDLDGASTARALRSLTAELTRRERVLAECGARDLAELPPDVLLPRLVIVVDEFATLGEELPGFVPGLVAIAQRGRSLGVHLVLATQRPSGSVSPEIRANCTVRLCLRTTDETGSRDVLGMPDAARLPVDRPGRALLRVGSEPPVLLQVARVGVPADAGDGVQVRRWPPRPATGEPSPPPGGTDLAGQVHALRARAEGLPPPPRPWLPALPDHVGPQDRAPGTAGRLRWGLVDRPDLQRRDDLLVDLDTGGGWLVVGGPRSGRTTALRTLLGEAVAGLGPGELHVHAVDSAGGELARAASGLPHTGTVVARGAGHRLERLVARLQEEVDRRRTTPGRHPRLLLLVDGVDPVTSELEELTPGSGGAALLRLVREGAAAGLTAVLTADRVLPGSRLAGAVGHRLLLPLADRADYAVAGVPAAKVPGHRPPGRALLDDDATEVQLALPRPLPDPRTDPGPAPVAGRVEVVELPADPAAPHVPGLRPGVALLGPGGDGGAPVTVDLLRTGGLLVAGPPGC